MINTTITIVSSDGNRKSEETLIVQSAGDVTIDEDFSSHMNSVSLDNVEHAVRVTLENIQEAIRDEEEAKEHAPKELPEPKQAREGETENGDDTRVR